MKRAYGQPDRIVMEAVYGKKLAAFVYGPNCEKLTDAQVAMLKSASQNAISSLAEYQAVVNQHPQDAISVGTFSLFGYADVLSKMMAGTAEPGARPAMNIFPTRAELPPKDSHMSFSMRVEGNTGIMSINVPIQPIRAFADVMKRKMKKMMEEMMRNRQRPELEQDELDEF